MREKRFESDKMPKEKKKEFVPPKELSSALKGLRFMARKDEQVKESKKIKEEVKLGSIQWKLPETTKVTASSVFAPTVNKPCEIVFRNALGFSFESDALAEIRMREKKHRKSKKGRSSTTDFGRFKSQDHQRVYNEEEDDDEEDSVDDVEVAKHFQRNKKKRQRSE